MRKILLFALLLFVISCRKEEPKKPTCVALETELVNAFNFKSGSYWVYKDSISGAVDSFVVTSYDTGLRGEIPGSSTKPGKSCWNKASIKVDIHHLSQPSGQVNKLEWESNSAFLFSDNFDFSWNKLLRYPFAIGKWSYAADSGFIDTIFQNYTIAGNTFTNVPQIRHKNLSRTYEAWFYLKAELGFIKMTLKRRTMDTAYIFTDSTSSILELQRFKIVR